MLVGCAMNELPLVGVTVLDFGQVYNGPYCGFLLAQAGARVIKVESPRGETLRSRGETTGASSPFAMLNGHKECISLNFRSARGQALLRDLVMHVDVVLENFAPGTLERYGVGARTLRGLNPELIYASSTGYGRSGAHRDYRGMDVTIQAMTGVMSITGEGDGPPLKAGPALADFLGGVHLYGGIVTALYRRSQTGEGAVIDISMQDCVFPSLTTALGAYFVAGGQQGPRTGNRHQGLSVAPYNVYAARDGYVAIICIREGHWRGLTRAMGRPELAEDAQFADMRARAQNMDAVDALVEGWTRTLDREEIFARAQAEGVICAPVQTLEDVINDPHLHERGSLHWHEHPRLGPIVLFNSPLRFEGVDLPEVAEVPYVGAHNAAVYSEFLGLDEDDIAELKQAEAI
jgi:crotonobetainyl-CoA:carnitine CoA-transferase CaiB-like acyl-CoA transferase